jgi:hypothetical protein
MGCRQRRQKKIKIGMSASLYIRSAFTDITPVAPCQLAGYDNRPDPFDSIADRIEANIIWITHLGKQVVLISIDTLFLTRTFKKKVIAAFNSAAKNKLREPEVFMIASHTHFSPTLDPTKPVLGKGSDEYILFVQEKIVQALLTLDSAGEVPASLSLSKAATRHSINRRRPVLVRKGLLLQKKIALGPNPSGPTSEKITMLTLKDDSGKVLAAIWHFACHPTDFPKRSALSAGYPGIIRKAMRSSIGEVPVLFLQGFAGDVKPWDHDQPKKKKRTVKEILLKTESFPHFDEEMFTRWSVSLSAAALSSLKDEGEYVPPLLGSRQIAEPITDLFNSGSIGNDELTFQEITLGEGLKIISISAEPVIEYEDVVKNIYKEEHILCCGYTDSVHIYLPTSAQVLEGGYECEGFQDKFSYPGSFESGLEKKVASSLQKLKGGDT